MGGLSFVGGEKGRCRMRNNAMKVLENRTSESKRDMDIIAGVEELHSLKSRQATVSYGAILEAFQRSQEEMEIGSGLKKISSNIYIESIYKKSKESYVRRINDDDDDDDDDLALAMPANESTSLLKMRKLEQEERRK